MQVKECMTPNCLTVMSDTSLRDAANMMRDEDIGFIPVQENDRMVGMITDRDIVIRCVAEGKDTQNSTVRDAMTEKTYYCFEDDNIDTVARNMGDIQVRRLPVVNREKRLVGVITLGDISQASAAKSGEATQSITQEIGSKKAA